MSAHTLLVFAKPQILRSDTPSGGETANGTESKLSELRAVVNYLRKGEGNCGRATRALQAGECPPEDANGTPRS
jgi:hypothetical protein